MKVGPAATAQGIYQVGFDYPIQLMNQIAKIPERLAYALQIELAPEISQAAREYKIPQFLAGVVGPSGAAGILQTVGAADTPEVLIARRDGWEQFITGGHADSALDGQEINWERMVGKPIDLQGTDTITKLLQSSGMTGIGWSLLVQPDKHQQFMDDVNSGLSVDEAVTKYEDWRVQLILESLVDPTNLAPTKLVTAIFPVGAVLAHGAGKVLGAIQRPVAAAEIGFAAIAERKAAAAAITELEAGGLPALSRAQKAAVGAGPNWLEWITNWSKRSRVTKYGDLAADALNTFAVHVNKTPELTGNPQEDFQRILLEGADGKGALLEALPARMQTTIKDFTGHFKARGSLSLTDLLEEYGAFSRASKLSPGGDTLVTKALEGANDPMRLALYLRTAITDQYMKEVGFIIRPKGSIARTFAFTTGLLRENWIGGSPAVLLQNATDNVNKTLISNYAYNPFDLPTPDRAVRLAGDYGIALPSEVNRTLYGDIAGITGRPEGLLYTEQVPLFGTPEGTAKTLESLTGKPFTKWYKQSWFATSKSIPAEMMRSMNWATLLKGGLKAYDVVEIMSRLNIWVQATTGQIEGFRPGWVRYIRNDPTVPSELADLWANPIFTKSADDIRKLALPYLREQKPAQNLAAYVWAEGGPHSNAVLSKVGETIQELQEKAGWRFTPELKVKVDETFETARTVARSLLSDHARATRATTQTPDETLDNAWQSISDAVPEPSFVESAITPSPVEPGLAERVVEASRQADEVLTGSGLEFDAQVEAARAARDTALNEAISAAQANPNPQIAKMFEDAQNGLGGLVWSLRQEADAFRQEAWDITYLVRNGEMDVDLDAVWATYRQRVTDMWNVYNELAVKEYGEITQAAKLPIEPSATLPPAGGVQMGRGGEIPLQPGTGGGGLPPVEERFKNPATGEYYQWPTKDSAEAQFWAARLNEPSETSGKYVIDLEDTRLKLWPVDSIHFESASEQAAATGHSMDNILGITRMYHERPGGGAMWNDVFIHDISGGDGKPISLEKARTAAALLKELGLSEDVRIIGGGIEAPLKEWVSLPPAELQGKYAILEREDWMAEWQAGGVKPLNPKQLLAPDKLSIPFQKASLPHTLDGGPQAPMVVAAFNDGRVGWMHGDNHMDLLRAAGFSRSDTSAWGMHMPDKRTWAFGGAREGIERMLKFMQANNRNDVVVRITLEDSLSDNWLFAGKLSDYWDWAAKTQLPPSPFGGPGVGGPMYSKLEDAINILPERVDPQQAKRTFVSQGVSLDERRWTGIDDFLNSKSGPVTKQELLDYWNANQVKVETVTKVKKAVGFDWSQNIDRTGLVYETTLPEGGSAIFSPQSRRVTVYDSQGRETEIIQADDIAQAEQGLRTFGVVRSDEGAQYSTYTLPGGENYREFLLKLPTQEPLSQIGVPLVEYQSPHWPELDVVVHYRTTDRLGPNGERILYVEEIQSDWHQAGREFGYQGEPARRMSFPSAQPPSGPFSKTWQELAIRKAVMQAAEEGYDMIAFPTADTISVAEHWADVQGHLPAGQYVDMMEGARKFYEEIVQQYVKKFAGRWGVQPETVTLNAQQAVQPPNAYLTVAGVGAYDVPAIRITPEMKASLSEEGIPLFGAPRPTQGTRPPSVGGGAGELPPEYAMFDDALAQLRGNLLDTGRNEYNIFMHDVDNWQKTADMKFKAGQGFQKQTDVELAAKQVAVDRYAKQWSDAVDRASTYGSAEVERILFDYAARQNWEELLRYYSPFTVWQTRNPLFWAQALMEKPGLINFWFRWRQEAERQRQRTNLTSRFAGTLPIPGQELAQQAGLLPPGYYATDPTQLIGPGAQFRQPFEPIGAEQPQNGWQKFYRSVIATQQFLGLRPYPWFEAAEVAVGLRPTPLRGDLFGSIQQVPGIGGALNQLQSAVGLGPTQANTDLMNYYVNRRLSEWAAQGAIGYDAAYAAQFNQQDPLYQQAWQDVQKQLDIFQAVRTFIPLNIKYASPGEMRIRDIQGLPREERFTGEFQQTQKYPFLDLYSRLFQTPEQRAVDDQIKTITDKYNEQMRGLKPDSQQWYDLQSAKGAEIAAVYANRPTQPDEDRAIFPLNREGELGERLGILYWLSDREPRPDDFLKQSGDVDWEVYDLAYQQFLERIPQLSQGMISPEEYDRFKNRYKTADEMMALLNKRRLDPGYDLLDALYNANSPEFEAALQQLLQEQLAGDVQAGMSEQDAQARAAETADYIRQNGLPYDFIQTMLTEYGPKPAAELVGEMGKMRPELVEGLKPDDVDYTLPGLGGISTTSEQVRRDVLDVFYNSLPEERDVIRQQLGISNELDFSDALRLISKENLAEFLNSRRPIKTSMTPEESAKMTQVERDWFSYNKAKAAFDAGTSEEQPVWTPLMEELYGNKDAPSSQFWELWKATEEWPPEAFSDPLVQLVLDKNTRKTVTDEQYLEAAKRLQAYAEGRIPAERSPSDVFWELWFGRRDWPDAVWDNSLVSRIMNPDSRRQVGDEEWLVAIETLRNAPKPDKTNYAGMFWELWFSRDDWPKEVFGDPVIQFLLDKNARTTAEQAQYRDALSRLRKYAEGGIPSSRDIQDVFWDVWFARRNWPSDVWDNSLVAKIMDKATRGDVSDSEWQQALDYIKGVPAAGGGEPAPEQPSEPAPPANPPPSPPTFPPPPPPPTGGFSRSPTGFLPASLQ